MNLYLRPPAARVVAALFFLRSFFLKLVVLNLVFVSAVLAAPLTTTYQAKIIKPDGLPLESIGVAFRFTVLDPGGACILYSESYSAINMSGSGGLVYFSLGSGAASYTASGTQTFAKIFNNNSATYSCAPGGPVSYTPLPTDARKVVMQFNDGSGWQTLPAMAINAVPYAMYAATSEDATKLNGKADSDFVEKVSVPTCAADRMLYFNGATFSCVTYSAGSGGVASVSTTGSVLSNVGTASAPVISITAASVSSDGYITSVDYAEFKSKLSPASATSMINSSLSTALASQTLAGDVSGDFSSTQVDSVGGKTSAQIATSVDDTLAATASATAGTIVKRDGSGNILASGLTAAAASLNYVDIYKPSSSFNVRLQAHSSLSSNYVLTLPATTGTAGQVLSTDGAGQLSWINSANGSVTSVSGTANEITSTGGATPSVGLADVGTAGTYYKVTTDSKGRVTSGVTILTLSDLPNTILTTSSNFAGDVSGLFSNITVNRIQGVSVTITSLSNNDILQYDGSKYVNRNIPTCGGSQYLTFNGTSFSCAADAGASGTIASLSVTGPISSTGGANPTLSIAQANSTTNGYLSSADWNTFNNKITSSAASIAQVLGYVPASAGTVSNLQSSLGALAYGNSVDLGSASATGTIADARLVDQTGVTSGTQYTKVTVDGKGRVISGAQLASADVTTALGYTPASTSAASQWNTSGTTINYLNGNVGIGTTTPETLLELKKEQTAIGGSELLRINYIANPSSNDNSYYFGSNQTVVTDVNNSSFIRGLVGARLTATRSGTGNVFVATGSQSMFNLNGGSASYAGGSESYGIVNSGTASNIGGVGAFVYVNNSATATNATGVYGEVSNSSTVPITNAYILRAGQPGGTITNLYGLYLDNMSSGTNNSFSIYSNGGKSYFAGNVGVGTSAPASALEVNGQFRAGNFIRPGDGLYKGIDASNSPELSYVSLLLGGVPQPASGIPYANGIRLSGDVTAGKPTVLEFAGSDYGGHVPKAAIVFDPAGNSFYRADIKFALNSEDNRNAYSLNDTKMIIKSTTGNVGIGITTPVTKLEVAGGVKISMESATCAVSFAGTLRYNTGSVEFCNGTTWSALAAGTAVSSFNGSTSATQTFAIGTSGNSPAFNTSNGVHTLNIPYASVGTTTAGLISNSDYANFSSKMSSALANGSIFVGNGSNVASAVAMSGDATLSNAGVLSLAAGSIVNADVSVTANIARSKLANGTANRVLINNGSGVMTESSITDTVLGYLSGVTSSIQTQLNLKAATTDYRFVPDFTIANSGSYARINSGGTALELRTPAQVASDIGAGLTVSNQGSSFTITSAQNNYLFLVSSTATVTLPALASVGSGFRIYIKRTGFGQVNVDANGSELIEGTTARSIDIQGGVMELVATSMQWELLRAASTGGANSACIEGSVTYSSPGQSSLTITDNMATYCTFTITVKGGGGGNSNSSTADSTGGAGGGTSFSWLPSVSGTLNIYVGGAGIGANGGLGGGGPGCTFNGSNYGGGGGGASAIAFNSTVFAIAGGGGGAGTNEGSANGGTGGSGSSPGSSGAGALAGAGGNNDTGGAAVGSTTYVSGAGGSTVNNGGSSGSSCGTLSGGPKVITFNISGGGSAGGYAGNATKGTGGGGGGGYGGGSGGAGSASTDSGSGGGGGGGYILSNPAITNITAVSGAPAQTNGSVIVTWSAR